MAEQKHLDDLQAFPILTSEVGRGGVPYTSGGGQSGSPAIGQIIDGALRTVLGWRPRANDPKGFVAALNQAFTLKEIDGHTTWTWTPRTYAVQADLGTITGAQASLYARAKTFLDQALPLLDGLKSLLPAADTENVGATQAIVRSELLRVVTEFSAVGGPVVQNVDLLLKQLIAYDTQTGPVPVLNYEAVPGHLGDLQERLGLSAANVNTVEEEQNLTNFILLVDFVDTLARNWHSNRAFFDRVGSDVFLGTQLILLSRQLEVLTESVQEAYAAMDSVFLGPEERQTTTLQIPNTAPITVAELLEWIARFSSAEGPRLLQDGGKDGAVAFIPTANTLYQLTQEAANMAKQNSGNPTRGFHTPRVQRTLEELATYLFDVTRLAAQVRSDGRPLVKAVEPTEVEIGTASVVTINGFDFQRVLTGPSSGENPKVEFTQGTNVVRNDISVTFTSSEQISARFTLPATTPTGKWTVVVINPGGARGELLNALTFVAPPPGSLTAGSPARIIASPTGTSGGTPAATSGEKKS
jgi:hypothetical protein